MIVCMLIPIYTGEKPNRPMYQMVWYELIGLASLKELESFIKSRKSSAPANPKSTCTVHGKGANLFTASDSSGAKRCGRNRPHPTSRSGKAG